MQMHRTLEILQGLDVDAQPLDFWSRDASFDIIHFWGFDVGHLLTAKFAARYNKKLVLTPLLQYLTPNTWVRYLASRIEGRARPRLEFAGLIDRWLMVNEQQAETAQRFFRVPDRKIEIIPTILEDRFFMEQGPLASLPDGFSDFVLCAGNICERKNQLRLARAAAQLKCPVLFAGAPVGGEESYAAEFESYVARYPFLRWEKWLDWSDLLVAYRASHAVVLPSFEEQQPTCGLEAAALGKPLMLGTRPYARQKFYQNALLVEPRSVDEIARGLAALRTEPARYIPPAQFVAECRADRVGPNLMRIFADVLAEG